MIHTTEDFIKDRDALMEDVGKTLYNVDGELASEAQLTYLLGLACGLLSRTGLVESAVTLDSADVPDLEWHTDAEGERVPSNAYTQQWVDHARGDVPHKSNSAPEDYSVEFTDSLRRQVHDLRHQLEESTRRLLDERKRHTAALHEAESKIVSALAEEQEAEAFSSDGKWKPTAKEMEDAENPLMTAILLAVGTASTTWNTGAGNEIFDSKSATRIAKGLHDFVMSWAEKEAAEG